MLSRAILKSLVPRSWTLSASKCAMSTSNIPDHDSQQSTDSDGTNEEVFQNLEELDNFAISEEGSKQPMNRVILRGDVTNLWGKRDGDQLRVYLAIKYEVPHRDGHMFVRTQKYRVDFFDVQNPDSRVHIPDIEIGDNVTAYTNIYNGRHKNRETMMLRCYYMVKHT